MGRITKITAAFGAFGAAMTVAAQTKPEDAISNLGAWSKWLGLDGVGLPADIDIWVTSFGVLLMVAAFLVWIGARKRSRILGESRVNALDVHETRATKRHGVAVDVALKAAPRLNNVEAFLIGVRPHKGKGGFGDNATLGCAIQLSWLTPVNFVPLARLSEHRLILFAINGSPQKLSLWWKRDGFPAVKPFLDEIPVGKYRFDVAIKATEGDFKIAFDVEWYGSVDSLRINQTKVLP
jgi:hypothetical protein